MAQVKMTDEDFSIEVENIKLYAKAIISECEKWQYNPRFVFSHGYAEEKANSILATLKRGE